MRRFLGILLTVALVATHIPPDFSIHGGAEHLAANSKVQAHKVSKKVQEPSFVAAGLVFLPIAVSDSGNMVLGALLIISMIGGFYWYFKMYLPRHPEIGKILEEGWVQMKHKLGERTGLTTRRRRPPSDKMEALTKRGFPVVAVPSVPIVDLSL